MSLKVPRLRRTGVLRHTMWLAIGYALISPLYALPRADRITVHKKEHTMELMHAGTVIKAYKIALGRNPVGPKQREGDFRTPEGVYVIDSRNAKSQYHRSLHISYPNTSDRERARKLHVSPGGDVMIHGLPNGYGYLGAAHRRWDWTYGCIAVTDEEIDEIWSLVDNGTPIEIRP
jgi:murein L,D-transpeptidase YafK